MGWIFQILFCFSTLSGLFGLCVENAIGMRIVSIYIHRSDVDKRTNELFSKHFMSDYILNLSAWERETEIFEVILVNRQPNAEAVSKTKNLKKR